MEYTTELIMPENCIDARGNVHAETVLGIFEKIAGAHGEEMGVGFAQLKQRGLLWVVVHIRYEVCRPIVSGQTVKATTWPLPLSRVGYERNYLICDEQGRELIRGSSLWVLIDTVQRRLALGSDIYPDGQYRTDRIFERRIRRLKDFEPSQTGTEIVPDASYIDLNGHVNNTKYALMARQALGELTGRVKAFQIDYIHEVLCGQPLTLYSESGQNTVQLKGLSADGTRMFACAYEFE